MIIRNYIKIYVNIILLIDTGSILIIFGLILILILMKLFWIAILKNGKIIAKNLIVLKKIEIL